SGNYAYSWTKLGDPTFTSSASSITVGIGTYTVLVTDLGKPGVSPLCPASATASISQTIVSCDPGTFNFGGSSSACNNRVFYSDNGVKVTVTAFSKSGTTWSQASIGQYSGGLGVTAPGETTSAPQHTLDNDGAQEYLLFQFSDSVII